MTRVSICMPYWNRPSELARQIASCEKLYPDLDIEFSVCDDGSASPPIPHPKMVVTTLPRKIETLNPCVPINRAVRQCKNDMIVLTNPETEHRERVFNQMLDAWSGPRDYIIAGCRDSIRGEWYAGEGRSMKGCLAAPGIQYHFCVLFHRELFERIGGFDEDYRQGHGYDDNDWTFRLQAIGANVKYVPGVVWHTRRLMQRSLWRGPQLLRNEKLLRKKWGHLGELACA